MKERPILFSAPMVRAILEGRKTQTRRVVKPRSRSADGVGVYTRDGEGVVEVVNTFEGEPIDAPPILCPYGAPGDRLWVRETHALREDVDAAVNPSKAKHYTIYRADRDSDDLGMEWHRYDRWRPSIHMPRWASRITLEVTGVRVERLHDITNADAYAEGCRDRETFDCAGIDARQDFARLWHEINGAESWDANPWVWVVEFERIEAQERAA